MKNTRFIIFCLTLLLVNSTASVFGQSTDKIPGTDCDNVVHNVLSAEAPNRSTSPCETQFDLKTRMALQDAFKLLRVWPEKEWVKNDTSIQLLTQVSKSSEKYFFQLYYHRQLDMNPESALYKPWYDKYQEAMKAIQSQPGEASMKKFMEVGYKVNAATHISITVMINSVSGSIYFMKGGNKTFSVPGASYAVRGSYAAPVSGGEVEDSKDACLIVFGNMKATEKKEPENGASVTLQSNFPKASHLTVQNIIIRIECAGELLDTVLKDIDLKKLADLVGH